MPSPRAPAPRQPPPPADAVRAPAAVGVRLSAFYFTLFCAIGVHMAYWPVWLESRGLGPAEISLLFAVIQFTRVLSSPAIALGIDRRGDRRLPLLVLAAGTTLAFLAYSLCREFWQYALVSVVASVFWGTIMPLGDSLALAHAKRGTVQYGRVRLWGSVSFILATLAGGKALSIWSDGVVLWLLVGAFAAVALTALLLPDIRTERRAMAWGAVWRMLRDPAFALLLGASAVLQASHLVLYIFGTLHWRAAGISGPVIGALWAESVVAEILLFLVGGKALQRLGAGGLFALAAVAGIVRWPILAATTDLAWLVFAQALHAFTFGATHLAAMAYIQRLAPEGQAATAQSLHGAVAMSAVSAAISPFLGPLYARAGGSAYLAMVGLSAAGGVLAFALSRRVPGGRDR